MNKISKVAVLRKLVWIKRTAIRLSLVFGLAYSVIQYERVKLDGQVKQTLSFYDKFNSSPFVGYRELLSDTIDSNTEQIRLSAKKGDEDFARVILAIVEKKDVKKSLSMIFDFFDGIAACMETGICDQDTAIQLFQARAAEIYKMFYPYIKKIRIENNNEEYAKGLVYVNINKEKQNIFSILYRKIISF
jgi:hypothetical protein